MLREAICLKTIPRKLPWLAALLLLILAGVYLLRWSAHPRMEGLILLALLLFAFVATWTLQKTQQRIKDCLLYTSRCV